MAEAINYGNARGYREGRAGPCLVLPLKLYWRNNSGGTNGGGSGRDDYDNGKGYRAALGLSSALRQWAVPSSRQDVPMTSPGVDIVAV